jgi:ADP-ribose pyrophosphatase YjhB (NUDIX family)
MAKICDNGSVGEIIERGGKFAIVERGNYPEAYACPAGHVDGDADWNEGVKRECREEVGLDILEDVLVFEEEIDNPCKREGGSHHFWRVYRASSFGGELKAGDDAKKASWKTLEELRILAARTEYFMAKFGISYEKVGALTKAVFGENPEEKKTDPEWKAEMGLEPVWYYILKKSNII